MQRHAFVAVGLAALLVIAGCSAGSSTTANTPTPSTADSTIRVAGSGSADAEPNQAVVDVAVVATAPDAATARRDLTRNVSRMRTALTDAGVAEDHITTQRYDIRQDRRRPREEGADPQIRYRAMHDFEITVTDPDRVGDIVDTAVANGATEVDDVSFTLSTDRRRELEGRARSAAMADARTKARALASDANLSVTGVNVIRTTRGGSPRAADEGAYATETPVATGAPPTDIESGPVTVRASVQVVYEAAPDGNATAG
ncbi:SIMPL domain-containing protein [Haloplanus ruber]|uniref:SIMPL domain-containing protein n=1 Tax=Haloplanus ruber TaxID=869892 RepID=A0ABD6CZJ5_9EURY|nr:SIMPL domain-containing protein [Haloplanus ruber]